MNPPFRSSRSALYFGLLAGSMAALLALLTLAGREAGEEGEAKGLRRGGQTLAAVIEAADVGQVRAPAAPATGFAPQTRLGYTHGDQWEPSIAADRFGHVYVLYPQYLGVPGCDTCPSPTMILLISADGGRSWSAPRQIAPPGTGQWDAQIVVDPVDGYTVYAAWLQNRKSDTVVAKSTDFGVTWGDPVVADHTNAGTDKPILAVHGSNVYVAFDHTQKIWVSVSHDGGESFTAVNVNKTGKLGWALAGGGAVDSAGNVYIGWAGYEQNGGAKGPVNLFVSRSADGGATWTNNVLDISGAPPDCSAFYCGWAFLGAQLTLTVDDGGTVYALWNAGTPDKAPERIYFSRSMDAGLTWSERAEVSTAPDGVEHAFPAIVAGASGDVRIGWMDARAGGFWNTYYRSSTDGGLNWSPETDLSTYVAGYDYITPGGFNFPFGDYFEMAIDDRGLTHAVWGEGRNYDTPGSIWYTHGR